MLLHSRLALRRFAIVIRIVRYLSTRPYHLNEDVLILSRCIELLRLGRKTGCDDLNGHVAADLNQIHRSAAFRVSFDLKIAVVLAVYGRAEDNCRVDERLAIKALSRPSQRYVRSEAAPCICDRAEIPAREEQPVKA